MHKYFILILLMIAIQAQAQLNCNETMIITPDTTVCKGEPVTLKARKRQNLYSVRFDGINDYIAVFNNATLNMDTAFTIECWFKPDTIGFYYLVSKGPDTTLGWYGLGRYPAFLGNSYFGGLNTGAQFVDVITGSSMNPPYGQWVHLCFTGTNSIRRLYINGVLQVETAGTISLFPNNYNLNIGRHQHTAFPYYTRGWMDELRIWKRALSQQEINDKMYKQLKASEENLLSLYYDFNQGNGFIVSDKSGNNNIGTMFNGVQWSTDVPFTYYSNDFNYQWSTGDTTQTITYNIPSSVTVSIIVTDGNTTCYDTVQVNVFAGPTLTASSTSFCSGDSVTLTASSGISYAWTTGDTTQQIIVSTAGQYQVFVVDQNGCNTPSNVVTVTENENPQPFVVGTGGAVFCEGESITLSTGAFSTYLWNTGSTDSAITVNSSGTYSVTVTNAAGCSGVSNSIDIEVVPSFNTSSIIGPVNVNPFQNYSYSVTQNTGNTYTWSADNGAIVNGQGTNSVTVAWNDNTSGQLMVVESNGICNDTAYLNVSIFNSIETVLQQQTQVYPNPFREYLTIQSSFAGQNLHYQISDITGRQIQSGMLTNNVIDTKAIQAGMYLLILTDESHHSAVFKLLKSE